MSTTTLLKGLVFDLDDTLYPQVDYKRSGFRAVSKWLKKHQNLNAEQSYAALEQILKNKGASHSWIFDDFVKKEQLPPMLAKEMTQVFIAHQPQLQCYPGVNQLLKQLRCHYLLGILTDGRQSSQEKKLLALHLHNKVDAILLSDSMNLNKPAGKLFSWFEEKFNLRGSQLAYIGDNPQKDFLGANHRGWLTIRILTGEHAALKLTGKQRAQIELLQVTDLLDWLIQNNLTTKRIK